MCWIDLTVTQLTNSPHTSQITTSKLYVLFASPEFNWIFFFFTFGMTIYVLLYGRTRTNSQFTLFARSRRVILCNSYNSYNSQYTPLYMKIRSSNLIVLFVWKSFKIYLFWSFKDLNLPKKIIIFFLVVVSRHTSHSHSKLTCWKYTMD